MLVPPGRLTFKELKSSSDAESENALLFAEKDTGQFFLHALPRVRIIRINQTKRHVDDGHLETKLDAEAGTDIAEFRKDALANSHDCVRLRLAAKENLLKTSRQT